MPAPPPLFAGNPASPRIQQLHADLEQSYMRPVSILDLNHLPTPDATRRAQRETEVFGLRCELEAIEFMIATAAQNPAFYPEQLSPALRRPPPLRGPHRRAGAEGRAGAMMTSEQYLANDDADQAPKLQELRDYSCQPLVIGKPPRYLFDENGRTVDRELVHLSVQLRMAEAQEEQTELLRRYLGMEHTADGKNHVQIQLKGSSVHFYMRARTPEFAEQFYRTIETELAADQERQKGGPADD